LLQPDAITTNKKFVMNQDQTIPWKRISAEGAAIVVSILLAFSIDAWWDTRQRQEDENQSLRSLLNELHTFREDLKWNDGLYDAIRESAVTLLNASLNEEITISDDQIDLYLYDLSWTLNLSWYEVPTLEAFRNSDLFTELDDKDLQRDLAYLALGIEGIQNDVLRYERFLDNQWTPFLTENASLPQIYSASSRVPGYPGEEYPVHLSTVSVSRKQSHQELLSSGQFQGLLQHAADLLADIFTRADGFDKNLTDLMDKIEGRVVE
jgi:hypothetical protein